MARKMYRSLFGVYVLHEFYLTDNNGTGVFDLGDPSQRAIFLQTRSAMGMTSIQEDFLFELPDFMNDVFKNYRLRLLAVYSGFVVVAEVHEVVSADGTTRYAPVIQIPDDLNLYVAISKRNNTADLITNHRMKMTAPFVYYFTNEDLSTPKVYPYLSTGIPAYDNAVKYELGELASFGQGKIQQFTGKPVPWHNATGDNPAVAVVPWQSIPGTDYVNTADQVVLPWQFDYRFDPADSVTDARFQLVDIDNTVLRSFEFKSDSTLNKTSLNFRNDKVQMPVLPTIFSGKIYSLSTTINDGKPFVQKVLFLTDYNTVGNYWAIVNIKPKPSNKDLGLFADDGYIKARKTAAATIAAPSFEIWVKSRFTYWRYTNDKNKKLKLKDLTGKYTEPSGLDLITLDPRPATYLPTLLNKKDYIVNPVSYALTGLEKGLILTNIPVPESEMFPVDSS